MRGNISFLRLNRGMMALMKRTNEQKRIKRSILRLEDTSEFDEIAVSLTKEKNLNS